MQSHDRVRAAGRSPRRAFLCGAAALAFAPLGRTWARALERRSLHLVHAHTSETLSCEYFRAGEYDAPTLDRVNHFLRDFRTGEVHPIDPRLLDLLYAVRCASGCDGPFQVVSGYRSPSTNALLRRFSRGVAEHSLHMQGRAIDVRVIDFPTRELRTTGLALRRGGVGYYPASDFVHLDTGRVRSW